jgi:hypothetical protein
MDARLKQRLTAIFYLPGLVPTNGSATVEGYTRHPWPRDDGIRHGHDMEARISRARQFLRQTQPSDTQDTAFRLLGLIWSGEDVYEIASAR